MNKFWNRLSVKLLFAIAVSFLLTLVSLSLFSNLLVRYIIVEPIEEMSILQYNLLIFITFTITILLFIVCFWLLIRKKIAYLNSITEGVQSIANGNLGYAIEVKGKDELSDLGKNINRMSKELQTKFLHEREIERTKNDLITSISHDLRTPLTSIIGYIELLRHRERLSDFDLSTYIETIHAKSQNLKHLIDELFTYNKLTSPDIQIKIDEVDLTSVIDQFVGEYIPILETEGLQVEKTIYEETLPVRMDVEKMIRVFDNLMTNASKYSIKPSTIKICLKPKENRVLFSISNQVIEAPAQDLDKLFDRFYRADQARKEDGGTGLGLAIAKRIVELHGGSIGAAYDGGWMTFTVEIPY